jgi:signal transduction histidine kinase/ActR/RegA family two-component response regulator
MMSTILQQRRIEHVLRATAIGLSLVIVFVAVAAPEYVSANRWVAVVLAIAFCLLLSQLLRSRKSRAREIEQTVALGKQRLSALSNLAAALADARTRSEVTSVVIEHGTRAAHADTCTLYILDAAGRSLELLGQSGCAEAVLEKIRRISDVEGNPETFATLRSGQSVWAESEADYTHHYPSLAHTKAEGPRARAFWSMPLVVEGQAVGLLGMGFYEPRLFANHEREFVETLVKQCAQALWRAVRYEREDEARRWLATTLVSIGDAVIATDSTGNITFMNRIAEALTGFGEAEARGWPLERAFSIFAEKSGKPVENPVAKVLREGAVVGLANHRAALAIENAVALRELEAARAEESRLRNESELASRAKDEFLAVVSHELRTPLNAILGWAVMMRRRNPTPEIDRGLSIIERNARSQAKLIEDVLDISRIISGKLSLSLAATNFADALAAAIETVTPLAESKGIRVVVEPLDRSLAVTADPDRVQQIIWNLLSNAVKFTPTGGQVLVRAYREGSEVFLVVRDDGEGIRPQVLPLIFDPFQQADASITRRHGGLGLGLAIVKQLVLAHGGTVRAESEGPGKGATFTVQLPARSVVPAVALSLRGASSIDLSPPTDQSDETRLDGLRVLIVDDEQDARMLVSAVLGDRGAETYLAQSAAEAIDKVITVKPDVIVSDIGMPETDGYTMLRRIRSMPDHHGGSTPAVALTAFAREEDAQRAFAAGFQMFVAKPIDPMGLAVAVAHLARREAQGQR